MRTVMGLFWSVIGGFFIALVLIAFIQVVGAGSDLLGFTVWTFRYYVVCLSVCASLLACSKPAQQRSIFMLGFAVAIAMTISVGFQASVGVSSTQDQVAQMQANFMALAMFLAKAVMYVAPGALTAFYAVVAFNGVSNAAQVDNR